jgi:hypothetical protein
MRTMRFYDGCFSPCFKSTDVTEAVSGLAGNKGQSVVPQKEESVVRRTGESCDRGS